MNVHDDSGETIQRRSTVAAAALLIGMLAGPVYLLIRLWERARSGPVDPGAIVSEAHVRLYWRMAVALWVAVPAGALLARSMPGAAAKTYRTLAVAALLMVPLAVIVAWAVP